MKKSISLFLFLFVFGQVGISAASYMYTDPVTKVIYKYWPERGYAIVKDGVERESVFFDDYPDIESGNPDVKGDIVILERFTVDGQEYVVNKIGDCAFAHCDITSVALPPTVKEIGSLAFYRCDHLTTLNFSTGLEIIDSEAFRNCNGLASVILPEGVSMIGSEAFGYCENLKSVSLPSTLEEMQVYTPFVGCQNLETITVDDANEIFDSRDGCNAVIQTSEDRLFAGCNTTVIPSTVKSIGMGAFMECKFPDCEIILPEALETIEELAFTGSNLKTITIPKGVTYIGHEAFSDISGLESIVSLIEEPFQITKGFGASNICGNPAVTLYVPYGTRGKYLAQGWDEFKAIIEMDAVGISGTASTICSHASMIYDLQGHSIADKPQKGMYIQAGKIFAK